MDHPALAFRTLQRSSSDVHLCILIDSETKRLIRSFEIEHWKRLLYPRYASSMNTISDIWSFRQQNWRVRLSHASQYMSHCRTKRCVAENCVLSETLRTRAVQQSTLWVQMNAQTSNSVYAVHAYWQNSPNGEQDGATGKKHMWTWLGHLHIASAYGMPKEKCSSKRNDFKNLRN